MSREGGVAGVCGEAEGPIASLGIANCCWEPGCEKHQDTRWLDAAIDDAASSGRSFRKADEITKR
jgi:hypothetical protein